MLIKYFLCFAIGIPLLVMVLFSIAFQYCTRFKKFISKKELWFHCIDYIWLPLGAIALTLSVQKHDIDNKKHNFTHTKNIFITKYYTTHFYINRMKCNFTPTAQEIKNLCNEIDKKISSFNKLSDEIKGKLDANIPNTQAIIPPSFFYTLNFTTPYPNQGIKGIINKKENYFELHLKSIIKSIEQMQRIYEFEFQHIETQKIKLQNEIKKGNQIYEISFNYYLYAFITLISLRLLKTHAEFYLKREKLK